MPPCPQPLITFSTLRRAVVRGLLFGLVVGLGLAILTKRSSTFGAEFVIFWATSAALTTMPSALVETAVAHRLQSRFFARLGASGACGALAVVVAVAALIQVRYTLTVFSTGSYVAAANEAATSIGSVEDWQPLFGYVGWAYVVLAMTRLQKLPLAVQTAGTWLLASALGTATLIAFPERLTFLDLFFFLLGTPFFYLPLCAWAADRLDERYCREPAALHPPDIADTNSSRTACPMSAASARGKRSKGSPACFR